MAEPIGPRMERGARLRWVPLAKMKVSPLAQRMINKARVDRLVAEFDPEQFGTLTVSERDGSFYVIDGQHRAEAARRALGPDQLVQCWVYVGLDEAAEAEKFLRLNDYLAVSAFDRFTKAVTANRLPECEIERIVRANGTQIAKDRSRGIRAVTQLRKVYDRAGANNLGRTVRLVHGAYGLAGFDASVIEGIGLLCQRYNGDIDDTVVMEKLGSVHLGVNGLLQKAETIRNKTGNAKAHCVAAAAVEVINAGTRKKIPSWWKS